MDKYYNTREILSIKYANMPLSEMKAEIKKSADACISRIEKIRKEKTASKKQSV